MSKKGKIALAVLALVLAGVIAVAAVNAAKRQRVDRAYAQANALFDAGQYEEAAEIYGQLDDWNAQRRCQQGITDREARALLDDGKADEALALLKSDNPDSELREEIVLALAEGLATGGDAEAAAQLVMDERAGDRKLRQTYEQLAEEQKFSACLDDGNFALAEDCLERVEELNHSTDAKTAAELEGLREALEEAREASKRDKAGAFLAEGNYSRAFEAYEALADAEGMADVVDALLEQSDLLSDTGRMNSAQAILENLLAANDEASAALARRLAEEIAAQCRAQIDAGERSDPWFNLQRLKKWAPSLWTAEWQALMDGCTQAMPAQSFVYRDTGLAASQDGADATATITAVNKTARGMLLTLTQKGESSVADSDSIAVFVCPTGQYTFTIRAGNYNVFLKTGFDWFGDEEGLGRWAETENVRVVNGQKVIEQGSRLEGSYSITLQ